MKYKFCWLSLLLAITLIPAFVFDKGSSSYSLAQEIFAPIFLIWMIWACLKILILLKQKIYPTTEVAILSAKNRGFNKQIDGSITNRNIATEHNNSIAKNESTIGKIIIGIFKLFFALVLFFISSETSSSKKSSSKKSSSNASSPNIKSQPKRKSGTIKPRNYGDRDKALEWEFDGEYLRPRNYGDRDKAIEWEFDGEYLRPRNYGDRDKALEWEFDGEYLRPRNYGDRDKALEWEFDGEYLRPRNYGDRDKAIEWEFDGEYLRPRNYGDRDKAIEWKYDSDIPIPVVAKAAGII